MKKEEFFYTENEILITYSSKMHNIIQLKSVKELILHNDCINNSIILMFKIQTIQLIN